MTPYTSYTERVLQPPPSILGIKLLPFSLGHSMLLKAAKSVFMFQDIEVIRSYLQNKDTAGAMLIELIYAVLACSTTYDEFLEEIRREKLQIEINDLVARVSTEDFHLFYEINKFADYLKKGCLAPAYHVKAKEGNSIKTNPVMPEESIKDTLMTNCNHSRNEALNLPLTETLSTFLLYSHKQDVITLLSKEVYELEQRVKKGNHVQS